MGKKVSIDDRFAQSHDKGESKDEEHSTESDARSRSFPSGSVEQYLENLWGADAVDYFFHPSFSVSRKTSLDNRKESRAAMFEQVNIGGYPTGMLQGSRVPFNPELKPWLLQPIEPELLKRRTSECARRPSLALLTSERRLSIRKPVGVSGLVDTLRMRAGVNPSATNIWELLRTRSYEMLMNLEKENKNATDTFSVFTREWVLSEKDKPPLCDFVRTNASSSLAETMKNLKAQQAEKQFRKTKASVAWAERNQNYFQLLLHQHDLQDMIARQNLKKGHDFGAEKPKSEPRIISQAEAAKLWRQADRSGIGSSSKPLMKDLFPDNWQDAEPEKEDRKEDHQKLRISSRETEEDSQTRCRCIDKLSRKLHYLEHRKTLAIEEGSFMKAQRLPNQAAPNSSSLIKGEFKKVEALCASPGASPVEPLCWSQLIEQQTQQDQSCVREKNTTK